MPLGNFEDMTESQLNTRQMEDQLAANGFCIPKKLRDACELERNIDSLLDEVQQIYFSDKENITTQEEHQAFLILSYVHIILFACWKMNVSILEALCKDDKDRGNVIKTILKLHFLYITGQINHETLTAVLTHVLARPFILQKAPIIDSRLVLLERVIPFIKAAHERVPVPPTRVFGGPVGDASYIVFKPPGQTIHPNNETSRTIEEYRAFLENHQPIRIPPHHGNLIHHLAQEFYPGGHRQDAAIQQKISGTARTMNISVGEHLLKAQSQLSAEQESAYYREGVHTAILAFLRERCGLSEEEAWRVSCSFHEGLGQMLHTHLNGIFKNSSLGISVRLDQKSLSAPVTEGINTAQLRLDAFFTITGRTVSHGGINASMTIMDHRTGQAQFEYSLARA